MLARAYKSCVPLRERVRPADNCSASSGKASTSPTAHLPPFLSASPAATSSIRPKSSLHAKRTKEAERTSPFPEESTEAVTVTVRRASASGAATARAWSGPEPRARWHLCAWLCKFGQAAYYSHSSPCVKRRQDQNGRKRARASKRPPVASVRSRLLGTESERPPADRHSFPFFTGALRLAAEPLPHASLATHQGPRDKENSCVKGDVAKT